ncbi:head-tail adaptor [Streptomyces phage Dubu]|uniref:Head-to-tail adaptor n=1 Tax=Streptomyces phage Dubu TaxID=2591226 RepID=A0A514DES8_9CAUD|nr:head-tail adaptor [Streptomyces phage Dubu]QDH92113.1 hypothetical protein SEA_DUBU_8 [Streptomyces phage Dubu]
MALPTLATVADLEARGVTIEPSEVAAVNVYLDVASTLVRDAAGSPISQTTSTVVLEGEPGPRLFLPGPPVRSVSAVLVDGQAVTGWKLASGALVRAAGWRPGPDPSEVTVTYVHGLPTVPSDIVDLVCRLVGQALVSYRSGETLSRAVQTERIGDYQVTYADTETGTMSLTSFQRDRLAARFGGGVGTARLR